MTPNLPTLALSLVAALLPQETADNQDPAPAPDVPPPSIADAEQGQTTRAGFEDVPQFGGPSDVTSLLVEDDAPVDPAFRWGAMERSLSPWFEWKGSLAEANGLAFALDYTALYEGANRSPGESDAASGILRLYGSWTLTGRGSENSGSLVFKGENRHTLGTAIPPSGLGFETGYVGLTAAPYNDAGWWLTNLYWQQRTNDGRLNLVAGQVDPTDYLDIYGMINPWTAFTNLAFLTGSGTMAAPDPGFGAALGASLGDHVYLVAGLADRTSDPADAASSAKSFFEDNEYFSHLELGWISEFDRRYLDNVHLTLWHGDESSSAGVPSGWGANFSYARFVDDTWMPFLRAGYSDDGGTLLSRSVSTGVGYYVADHRDLLGFGVNWGQPSQDFGPDLSDQWTTELFYRYLLSDHLAITPDIQYVVNPALHPSESGVFYFGVRARLAL